MKMNGTLRPSVTLWPRKDASVSIDLGEDSSRYGQDKKEEIDCHCRGFNAGRPLRYNGSWSSLHVMDNSEFYFKSS